MDIEAGEKLVNSIKSLVGQTHNEQVLTGIGGFGGLFAPDLKGLKEPVFVSSVDGVGTKLIVAFKAKRYDTVGQDLVNHCINDIAVSGAKPLFFLDYFSTGHLEQHVAYEVIRGFALACKKSGVALIGGETAEMPDIYKEGEFDLAGTIVGIVDKNEIITGESIKEGDRLIAIPSSGLHTNGYSLARKVLLPQFKLDEKIDSLGMTLADSLLEIHKSYLPAISEIKNIKGVHGFSHITGGGIEGNTRRILPEGLALSIEWESWRRPAIFELIQETGNVPEEDMRKTFNLGAGLIVIADPDSAGEVKKKIHTAGEQAFDIGKVTVA